MPIFLGENPRKPLITEAFDAALLAAETKKIIEDQRTGLTGMDDCLSLAVEYIPQVTLDGDGGLAEQALRLAGITQEELGEASYAYLSGYLAACMMQAGDTLWSMPTYVERFSLHGGSAIAV